MNKIFIIKIFAFGLLQWFLLMIAIFIISLIYGVKEGAEMTAPPPLGMAIVVGFLIIISYAFGRWLKPVSRKQAVIAGLLWSGMTTVFMVVMLLVNGTQGIFLASWVAYLLFIAQAVGSMLVGVKKKDISKPSPTA
ncbi:MAG: hypothetical protein WC528_05050 [Patescibacteria group bacterium]